MGEGGLKTCVFSIKRLLYTGLCALIRHMAEESTREHLLSVAERLFAERGIDSVSLREINKAAKQKNTSATHYHFGTKEGLIEAILDRRMPIADKRRLDMLEELRASEMKSDLYAIIRAQVIPLAERLDTTEGWRNYIIVLSRLHNDRRMKVAELISGNRGEGNRRVWQLIKKSMDGLPSEVIELRRELLGSLFLHGMADRARGERIHTTVSRYVDNLVDSMVGLLTAPVTTGAGSAPRTEQIGKNEGEHVS